MRSNKSAPLVRGAVKAEGFDWGVVVGYSLPPSFASQNPPPSSEGGTVSKFKFTPYTHEHGVREQRKKFFRRYPNTIWFFTVKERMFSYENQN